MSPPGATAERLRSAGDRRVEQRAPGRFALDAHAVSRAIAEALRVFELTQFAGDIDQHIRVRADPECAAAVEESAAIENAVAEIAFGDRAEAGGRAACGERSGLGIGHVGGVDQAPALVDGRIVEQPFDRPLAGPGETGLDLAHLLGRVDVHWHVRGHSKQRCELVGRDRAQAVRGDPDVRAIETLRQRHGSLRRAAQNRRCRR